jgi:anti-sigma regulatory factor (Ser/Thr protein kinase)
VLKTTLTVPNRIESVRPATAFLVQAARGFGVPRASDPVFEVAISEAITNAVKHGSRNQPSSTITCEVELEQDALTLRIIDDGSGFVVRSAELPTSRASASRRCRFPVTGCRSFTRSSRRSG